LEENTKMAEKTIEELVEERRKDATERKIAYKAKMIAREIGEYHQGLKRGKAFVRRCFRCREFEIDSFTSWPDDRRNGGYEFDLITVLYRRNYKEVFCQCNGEIETYIPGSDWLGELDELFKRTPTAKQLEDPQKQKEKKEADLRRRFGLFEE